jgi:iron complex transport system ATP-binding protein
LLQAIDISFSYRPHRSRSAILEMRGRSSSPTIDEHSRLGADLVLDRVSLAVEDGDLVGILGPNGSGKTTLLSVLAGALVPQQGTVRLEDKLVSAWSRREIARRLAMVPQATHAPFDFTVLDIVLMGRFPHLGTFALEGPEDLVIARQALEATGTAAFETRGFNTLSGGEKQRVAIASALAQSPRLLLLDEPTASLDIGHQMEVQVLLERLNIDSGVTMVLSTHDLNLAATLCRRLILLKEGRVVAAGPTADVLTSQTVRTLYGVDADVDRHPRSGRLTVVPIGRA